MNGLKAFLADAMPPGPGELIVEFAPVVIAALIVCAVIAVVIIRRKKK